MFSAGPFSLTQKQSDRLAMFTAVVVNERPLAEVWEIVPGAVPRSVYVCGTELTQYALERLAVG
jgi:hypothetical protein